MHVQGTAKMGIIPFIGDDSDKEKKGFEDDGFGGFEDDGSGRKGLDPEPPAEPEKGGNGFHDKVKEAREEMKEIQEGVTGTLKPERREEPAQGLEKKQDSTRQDRRKKRDNEAEGLEIQNEDPLKDTNAGETLGDISPPEAEDRGESRDEAESEELEPEPQRADMERDEDKWQKIEEIAGKSTEDVEGSDEASQKQNIDEERLNQLESRLESLEESLENVSGDQEDRQKMESMEERIETLESMKPEWDLLGEPESRDEDSMLVTGDLEAIETGSGGEIEGDLGEKIEELEERVEDISQEGSGDLEQRVEKLETDLRGEEIEMKNRMNDMEKDLKAVKKKIGRRENDVHGKAREQQLESLQQDVKDLSSAVVEISKKVYEEN